MVDEYTRHLERNKEVKGKGLSQFRMKVLADVLLFFSPFSVAVLPHIVGTPSRENMFALSVCVIGEAISWASIPMFAWLLYQGFEWTGNAWLYGLRLLVLALIVLGILDLMYAWRTSVLKVVLSAGVIIIGLLWDFMLSIGQTQRLMNVGIVTLGMCVTYYYLHSRENTMVFTAAIFGAACVLTPGLGAVALHYRNDKLGYTHRWTRWAFYPVYPIMLVLCAAIGMAN